MLAKDMSSIKLCH